LGHAGRSLETLDDGGDTHAAADAQGAQAEPLAASFELVDDLALFDLFLAAADATVDDLVEPPWPVTVRGDASPRMILASASEESLFGIPLSLFGLRASEEPFLFQKGFRFYCIIRRNFDFKPLKSTSDTSPTLRIKRFLSNMRIWDNIAVEIRPLKKI